MNHGCCRGCIPVQRVECVDCRIVVVVVGHVVAAGRDRI